MSLGNGSQDRNLDLDAVAAARRAARGQAPTITFGGRTFALPLEMNFSLVELIAEMDRASDEEQVGLMRRIAEALFGDQLSALVELGISHDDLGAVIVSLPRLYGMRRGESGASREQSEPTTEPSRPTSDASTA